MSSCVILLWISKRSPIETHFVNTDHSTLIEKKNAFKDQPKSLVILIILSYLSWGPHTFKHSVEPRQI